MATVAGIKIKTKVKKPRNPIFYDEKYTGTEPVWNATEAEKFTDPEFNSRLIKSLTYYNYYYSPKDCKPHVIDWMKTNPTFTKDQVRKFTTSGDRCLRPTACGVLMSFRAGMPQREKPLTYLVNEILKAISISDSLPEVEEATTTKAVAYKPNIQDRLNEKTSELIGEIEGYYDDCHLNLKVSFKPYDFLTSNNVPQSQLTIYEDIFRARRAELEEALAGEDEQLKEGYSHYKTADFKRLIKFNDELLTAIDQYRSVKKATKRAKVRKAPSKEKVVSRIKYAKENKELKVVSISPTEIVGCQELWIYNHKTRKIGKYVAEANNTLSVKGTSITNFDEIKSVAKTLRKPEEQLKEFAKVGKIALRTFLKEIRAVEIKLNGRINADTLLLKVG